MIQVREVEVVTGPPNSMLKWEVIQTGVFLYTLSHFHLGETSLFKSDKMDPSKSIEFITSCDQASDHERVLIQAGYQPIQD